MCTLYTLCRVSHYKSAMASGWYRLPIDFSLFLGFPTWLVITVNFCVQEFAPMCPIPLIKKILFGKLKECFGVNAAIDQLLDFLSLTVIGQVHHFAARCTLQTAVCRPWVVLNLLTSSAINQNAIEPTNLPQIKSSFPFTSHRTMGRCLWRNNTIRDPEKMCFVVIIVTQKKESYS